VTELTPKEVTAEYVKQIISACEDSSSAEFVVTDLLAEYASKVYKTSREEFVKQVIKQLEDRVTALEWRSGNE
jgi:hypothetical protein